MPQVGVPNNPSGANNWQGMGTEEPYGQKTKDAALKGGAPLAGAALSSGPIAAPRRATRHAQGRTGVPPAEAASGAPAAPQDQQMPYDAKLAQWWQNIASVPGASDLVKQYAQLATARLANG